MTNPYSSALEKYRAASHTPRPPMTKPLSPAAQAVLDAFLRAPCDNKLSVAAVLRAAADQVVPETTTPWNSTLALIMSTREVRAKFLAIAAELEGAK